MSLTSFCTDITGNIPNRHENTVFSYRRKYVKFLKNLTHERGRAPDLNAVIEWYNSKNGAWTKSTIRQYRGVISQAILDEVETDSLHERCGRELLARLRPGPSPRMEGSPRTSARKRKSLPKSQFDRLDSALRAGRYPEDILTARVLTHNCRLFMRPCEWETATVDGNALLINNAKSTNDRSFGPIRTREMDCYSDEEIQDLRGVLQELKMRATVIGGFDILWDRMRSRISRVCKTIGIKRVALYTTRHVGISNAKTPMTPEQVAAAAGQKTTRTSTQHYAKKSSGWGPDAPKLPFPSKDDVDKIIRSKKTTRDENIRHLSDINKIDRTL